MKEYTIGLIKGRLAFVETKDYQIEKEKGGSHDATLWILSKQVKAEQCK